MAKKWRKERNLWFQYLNLQPSTFNLQPSTFTKNLVHQSLVKKPFVFKSQILMFNSAGFEKGDFPTNTPPTLFIESKNDSILNEQEKRNIYQAHRNLERSSIKSLYFPLEKQRATLGHFRAIKGLKLKGAEQVFNSIKERRCLNKHGFLKVNPKRFPEVFTVCLKNVDQDYLLEAGSYIHWMGEVLSSEHRWTPIFNFIGLENQRHYFGQGSHGQKVNGAGIRPASSNLNGATDH